MIVSRCREIRLYKGSYFCIAVHVVVEKEKRPLPSLHTQAAAPIHCEALGMLRKIAERRICEEFCAAQKKTNCSLSVHVRVFCCRVWPNEKILCELSATLRELKCHQLLYSTLLKIMINKTFLYFYITSMFSTHYARFFKCTPSIFAI